MWEARDAPTAIPNKHFSFFLETASYYSLLGRKFSFGISFGRTRCVLLSCSCDSDHLGSP